ncbi:MAG: CDP-alcohol phosphatidyltransferase family protein [Candidatus Marinimicrobia bacterium]|jgi:CDP-diacylglycerol--glycerol-3-phosphate 3-phosphatidyltransferase|nr:CDP-alcohol phosphatidyltransferase family protein [Candidatus Neomarinimicrobiota bacterium]MDP6593199.1 CDP-alcohol phosphatidyltransferase family protein [Candidatus Neomarinimicrobiota bacterium]MDP6835996.1 CDP-alcohol phosphatidyltransferase family protein [Candidatus Neomarinimicrobiota bacterium]MDP6966283.1 CDP-alcohol phosphatidyltransferase family protein [Candidatus Neomarinimicrobiota bacterium]|tara:strand:+ start:10874 stop:11434 length:561 start_codon:yes stop_codon:yes gene_type:complete
MHEEKPIRITDPTRVITLSNGLSVLRGFLSLPIVYCLEHDYIVSVVILILIAVATDFLDGYFARKAHEVTNLGKILDPVADSIAVAAVVLFLSLDTSRSFPFWFFVLYMTRQLTIALGGVYLMNHYAVVLSSNYIGKWTVSMTALAILLYVLRIETVGFYIVLLATLLALISWVQYILRHFSQVRE